jgi:hypothetical protein
MGPGIVKMPVRARSHLPRAAADPILAEAVAPAADAGAPAAASAVAPAPSRGWDSEGDAGHIRVGIDELVLHGFEPVDRRAVGEAVERELARLLVDSRRRGLADEIATGDDRERLDGGTVALDAGATPRDIGIQLARAIHASLPRSGVSITDSGHSG